MSTAFAFKTSVDSTGVTIAGRSLGAHLAAKLESFSSDERTLTDELCDMLCIWLQQGPTTGPTFMLDISKTTVKQEKKNGADLRVLIQSPDGSKDCLFQAKVLDPLTGKLRCATSSGYVSLRKQLVKARGICGDLAFLLVYVPSQHLNGASHGFGSWEQGFCVSSTPGISSMYGATAIPVNSLIDPYGAWIDPVLKVPHMGGNFSNGVAFSQLLLELLVCFRGSWGGQEVQRGLDDNSSRHFLTLYLGIKPEAPWDSIRKDAYEVLRRDEQ